MHEELNRVPWIHRLQNGRLFRDLQNPEQGDTSEPQQHDGTEHPTDLGGAAALKEKENEEHEGRARREP